MLVSHLQRLAATDHLTGAWNRAQFDRLLAMQSGFEAPRSTSLILLDLDSFKRINDRHGHLGGDAVLRQVALLVRGLLHADELVGRIGGEEFAVVYPDSTPAEVLQRCEMLRAAVAAAPLRLGEVDLQMTISIGLAHGGSGRADRSTLMRAADARPGRRRRRGPHSEERHVHHETTRPRCAVPRPATGGRT